MLWKIVLTYNPAVYLIIQLAATNFLTPGNYCCVMLIKLLWQCFGVTEGEVRIL